MEVVVNLYCLLTKLHFKAKNRYTISVINTFCTKIINLLSYLPRFSEQMAKKSVIVGLPIVPYNQNKLGDCCQYLEYVQDFLVDITKDDKPVATPMEFESSDPNEKLQRKKKILSSTELPLCGDLLGRERISGAKRMRGGCDHRTERFDNIVENVAQWHTKQSFLGVITTLEYLIIQYNISPNYKV